MPPGATHPRAEEVWQAVRARELFTGEPVPPETALAAQRALMGRDETSDAAPPRARTRRSAPLALLGFGMLAIGGLLYGVVLWLENEGLGYGQVPAPVMATPSAAPADVLPTDAAAFGPAAESNPQPWATPAEPSPSPTPEVTPDPYFVGPPEPTAAERLASASPEPAVVTPEPSPTPSPSPSPSPSGSPTPGPLPTSRPRPR